MPAPGQRLSWVIALGAVVAISFFAGKWSSDGRVAADRNAEPPPTAQRTSPGRAPIVIRPQADPRLEAGLRAEIRAAIREELAQADDGGGPGEQEPEPAPLSAGQQTSLYQARNMLGNAIDVGRMTRADHENFHALIGPLPRPEQEALLARLVASINAQELDIELR